MSLPLSISRNASLLLAFALITASVLSFTYQWTRPHIIAAERQAAEKALLEIVPAERIDNNLLTDTLLIPEDAWAQLGLNDAQRVHLARRHQRTIAVILPTTASDGYSGDITMLVGVNRDGTIAGVRVISHNETPGLGDKIDLKKSDWITGFDGRSLTHPKPEGWKVKKDGGEFDQLTGATITPRAVVSQVHDVLQFVKANQALLFESLPTIGTISDPQVVDNTVRVISYER